MRPSSWLVKHVQDVLTLSFPMHLWSDSTTTLAPIHGHPTKWKTYVANQVSKIQRLLPDAIWHHVASKKNPADCASRGLTATELRSHDLWWLGPQWLQAFQYERPTRFTTEFSGMPDQRVLSHVAI